ncbi:uncharacterized protein LOC143363407 [Halictus rubicundus]|uniref:uncharacterized protein LOC143363407 n=1 Tax=Halictus rubicundus TaxID=77578 RepID=UPI004034FA73
MMLGGYETQPDYYPQWDQPDNYVTQQPYGELNGNHFCTLTVSDADSQSTYWGADSLSSGGSSGAANSTASMPPLIEEIGVQETSYSPLQQYSHPSISQHYHTLPQPQQEVPHHHLLHHHHHPQSHRRDNDYSGVSAMSQVESGFQQHLREATREGGLVMRQRKRKQCELERARNSRISKAYANLRDCMPNILQDTKLSRVNTIRLATSYIGYLMA